MKPEEIAGDLTKLGSDWYSVRLLSVGGGSRFSYELVNEAGTVAVYLDRRFGNESFEPLVNWSAHGSVAPAAAASYAKLVAEAARFADFACRVLNR